MVQPARNTLDQLLTKYQGVFSTPTTLPPTRPEDHSINLTTTQIPKVRGIGRLTEQKSKALQGILQELQAKNILLVPRRKPEAE